MHPAAIFYLICFSPLYLILVAIAGAAINRETSGIGSSAWKWLWAISFLLAVAAIFSVRIGRELGLQDNATAVLMLADAVVGYLLALACVRALRKLPMAK